MKNIPPFTVTNRILQLSQDISYELGILSGAKIYPVPIALRRKNKIKTIQSSLAIEGNTLTTQNVTDIIDGKRVLAPEKDIKEVLNAIAVYDKLPGWNPLSIKSFKKAHSILMSGLTEYNGMWRNSGVGIFKGTEITHMAPPAKRIPALMDDLFNYLKQEKEVPWLIKACIFHYELEFIHPFIDGNGRMGRLWQQLLLMKENPIFEFISVESMIKHNQTKYYAVLGACDKKGESTEFITFSLEQILTTLKQYTESNTSQVNDAKSRLAYAKEKLHNKWFTRKQYISLQNNIASATASRDLIKGVQERILAKKGKSNRTCYCFLP